MTTLDNKQYVPIIITSEDLRTVAVTLKTVIESVYINKQIPALFHTEATGLIMGRNAAQKMLSEYFGDNVIRGFYIDSDIVYNGTAEDLAKKTVKADNEKYSFVLPYKDKKGNWNLFGKDGERLTEVPKGKRVYGAGLGFYYGDIFPSYRFEMKYNSTADITKGEDIAFFEFLTKKKVKVICEEVSVGHVKAVQIW